MHDVHQLFIIGRDSSDLEPMVSNHNTGSMHILEIFNRLLRVYRSSGWSSQAADPDQSKGRMHHTIPHNRLSRAV